MTRGLFIFLIFCSFRAAAQDAKPFAYDGSIKDSTLIGRKIGFRLGVYQSNITGTPVFTEKHTAIVDSNLHFHLEIGAGNKLTGIFDSIIWSDGVFYLKLEGDPESMLPAPLDQTMLMRIPSDLNKEFEQGTVEAAEHKDWGRWVLTNRRGKRPRLVTIDLSTSYVNIAYPGGSYPVYRHFEWCDEDRDGTGNSFMISYSEHTTNQFIPNTKKLGDVKLYPTAFQQLFINSGVREISLEITKPVTVKNHAETYSIKGPWKFIYYIEW